MTCSLVVCSCVCSIVGTSVQTPAVGSRILTFGNAVLLLQVAGSQMLRDDGNPVKVAESDVDVSIGVKVLVTLNSIFQGIVQCQEHVSVLFVHLKMQVYKKKVSQILSFLMFALS